MEAVELLKIFSDPSTIENLTTTQKLWASLFTTILGMGITFVVLVVLQFVIGLFEKLSGTEKKPPSAPSSKPPKPAAKDPGAGVERVAQAADELVPVITASIAMLLGTSASNIRIRNITPMRDTPPLWRRAGIAEQMQNRV